MQIDILTLFPKIVEANFTDSIMSRAIEKGIVRVNVHDLRKWTTDSRKTVDDKPFGGGPGMLLMIEPIYKALKELEVYPNRDDGTRVALTSARGEVWNQSSAQSYATDLDRLVIICGRYEGIDHRVVEYLIDTEISIGNFVLSGGELAANVISDSIIRLLPGALGNPESLNEESHNEELGNGEYPQYTRPAVFRSEQNETWEVPDILMSGDHQKIADWKNEHTKS